MRNFYLSLLLLLVPAAGIFAQNVGIGTSTPTNKLDVAGWVKVGDQTTTGSAVAGVIRWSTVNQCMECYDGTSWNCFLVGSGDGWLTTGNSGTSPGTNFVGTTDAQDLVFSTNGSENMRINTNGNVGIGTASNLARLYVNTSSADNTTNYGIYNNFDGTDASTTYGIYNRNYGSGNNKYGFYNIVNSEGTGFRYGLYNSVTQNSASNSTFYGHYNALTSYGSGSHYGTYTDLNVQGTNASSLNIGDYVRVDVGSSAYSGTTYGEYLQMDYFAGVRYGTFRGMTSNATYDGDLYASYNRIYGTGDGTHHATYNSLEGSGNGTHYGTYNIVSNTGTGSKYATRNNFDGSNGIRYGLYNYHPSETVGSTIYGVYNLIQNDNSSTKFGFYNSFSANDGVLYGVYNFLNSNTTATDVWYGNYTYLGYSNGGTRYGNYTNMFSSNTYDGEVYGNYINVSGSNDDYTYGNYVNMTASSSGRRYGSYHVMNSTGNGINYGIYNELVGTGSNTKYGMYNDFGDVAGTKYGVYNNWPNGTTAGASTSYGVRNYFLSDNSGAKYGVYNYFSCNDGVLYGVFNSVNPSSTHNDNAYGVYASVGSSGSGTRYAGYFFTSGSGNYGVYGYNNTTGGWAGYFYGDVYAHGNLVVNEGGIADHDVRIEGDTEDYLLFTDASLDMVRVGSASDYGSRSTLLFDVDNGSNTGTEIGIGSVEYLLDNINETTINNDFSPTSDDVYDLGSSALRWNAVWAADGTINTSDRRLKKDIVDLNYGLKEIMALRPVSYKWKKQTIGDTPIPSNLQETKLGLIAQEVQQVVPEAVVSEHWEALDENNPARYTLEKTNYMGMSYDELIPVLIKAIQEQQSIIDQQGQRIKALESQSGGR